MVLSASNLSLSSVEGRGKDMSSYRAPKAPGSLVLRMMQSSSWRASETLIMEREREREGTRREEQEQTKETRHPVRTRKATALLCIKYRFNTLLTIKINPIMKLLNGEANTRECKLYYLNFYKIKKQGYQHKHLYFGRISKL